MFENMRLATLFDMFLNPSFEMTASFVKIIDCCQQHRLSIIFACLVSAIVCFSKFSFCISWPEVTKEQLTIAWNFIQIKKFNTSLDSLHRFPLSLRWSVWLLRRHWYLRLYFEMHWKLMIVFLNWCFIVWFMLFNLDSFSGVCWFSISWPFAWRRIWSLTMHCVDGVCKSGWWRILVH